MFLQPNWSTASRNGTVFVTRRPDFIFMHGNFSDVHIRHDMRVYCTVYCIFIRFQVGLKKLVCD